ncbi:MULTISPECIES: hypothetical protein [Streptomyces]|nr:MULTISPECIES: hypothetical protein [Streptomyces]
MSSRLEVVMSEDVSLRVNDPGRFLPVRPGLARQRGRATADSTRPGGMAN